MANCQNAMIIKIFVSLWRTGLSICTILAYTTPDITIIFIFCSSRQQESCTLAPWPKFVIIVIYCKLTFWRKTKIYSFRNRCKIAPIRKDREDEKNGDILTAVEKSIKPESSSNAQNSYLFLWLFPFKLDLYANLSQQFKLFFDSCVTK